MTTGDLLKKYRAKAKLTQKNVADHFGFASSQIISNCERGICAFPLREAKKLCAILNIPHPVYKKAYHFECELKFKKQF